MDAGDYYHEGRTNLIINYLPQSFSDAEFKSLFLSIGPIKSCKIIRNKATGYSYGFGFVDYESSEYATRAISTLNGFQVQNKRIKVAYARPSSDMIKNANLYIKGIPPGMGQTELESLFSQCGHVIQCRIIGDGNSGPNKGIGFVLYDLREQAEEAIKQFSGQVLPGGTEPLTIKFAEDNSKKLQQALSQHYVVPPFRGGYSMTPVVGAAAPSRNRYNPVPPPYSYTGSEVPYNHAVNITASPQTLFVYNIGQEADENALWQLFGQYGVTQKVNIARDQSTGQSKGYAFVTMSNYEEAVWAVESLNGIKFGGRPLQVSFKTQKS